METPISPYRAERSLGNDGQDFSIMTFVCVPLLIGTLVIMIFRIKNNSHGHSNQKFKRNESPNLSFASSSVDISDRYVDRLSNNI